MEDNKKPMVVMDPVANLELADLNPNESAPVFTAVRGKDWIPYTTPDGKQQYPDKLTELYSNSALHGAIVRSKIDQVSGNGFVWDPNEEGAVELATFMEQINSEEDANEILTKMSNDLILFGGISLIVNWSKDWTKIVSVEHVDFSKIRAHVVNDQGKIPGWWYGWDWTKQRNDKVLIPSFNEGTAKENKDAYLAAVEKGNSVELQNIFLKPTTQIFVFKPYRSGYFYYPLPDYVGAINAIETDILTDQYGTASFENGLNTNIQINFTGYATEDSRIDAARKFLAMYTGARNTNLPFITFSDDPASAPTITPVGGSKEDKVYTSVNENTMQKILSGHRVTDPILVGIKQSGAGFNGGESLALSIGFWETTVITPFQYIITKMFNKILEINEFPTVSIDPMVLYEAPEAVTAEPNDGTEGGTNTEIAAEDLDMDRMVKVVTKEGIKKKHAYHTKKNISNTLKNKNIK